MPSFLLNDGDSSMRLCAKPTLLDVSQYKHIQDGTLADTGIITIENALNIFVNTLYILEGVLNFDILCTSMILKLVNPNATGSIQEWSGSVRLGIQPIPPADNSMKVTKEAGSPLVIYTRFLRANDMQIQIGI